MSSVVKDLISKNIIRPKARPQNLFQLLSNLPKDGLNGRVAPIDWTVSTTKDYYTITHVKLSPGMSQGIACGIKMVNGKPASKLAQPIPYGLAYNRIWTTVPASPSN